MKRYKSYKSLKRPKFLTRPLKTTDIADVAADISGADTWLMQQEKRETKRLRQFRQQHA